MVYIRGRRASQLRGHRTHCPGSTLSQGKIEEVTQVNRSSFDIVAAAVKIHFVFLSIRSVFLCGSLKILQFKYVDLSSVVPFVSKVWLLTY